MPKPHDSNGFGSCSSLWDANNRASCMVFASVVLEPLALLKTKVCPWFGASDVSEVAYVWIYEVPKTKIFPWFWIRDFHVVPWFLASECPKQNYLNGCGLLRCPGPLSCPKPRHLHRFGPQGCSRVCSGLLTGMLWASLGCSRVCSGLLSGL